MSYNSYKSPNQSNPDIAVKEKIKDLREKIEYFEDKYGKVSKNMDSSQKDLTLHTIEGWKKELEKLKNSDINNIEQKKGMKVFSSSNKKAPMSPEECLHILDTISKNMIKLEKELVSKSPKNIELGGRTPTKLDVARNLFGKSAEKSTGDDSGVKKEEGIGQQYVSEFRISRKGEKKISLENNEENCKCPCL